MPTSHRVTQRATGDGLDAVVVERDYVLAHLVAQLGHVRLPNGQHLLLKGGTADLDFTILGGGEEVAVNALGQVVRAASEHGQFPVLELVTSEKLVARYIGPCGASKPRDVKVDISTDEYVEGFVPGRVSSAWPDLD